VQLTYYPNPILTQVCPPAEPPREPVTSPRTGKELPSLWREMAKSMWKIMADNDGVGLAAPQVGVSTRMFVWRQNGGFEAIWNPQLSCLSGEMKSVEGCLSLPRVFVALTRATSSIMTGIGMNGLPLRLIGDESVTRIWQHEIDHLDGKLIIDQMSKDQTAINRKALRRLLKKAAT